MEQVLITIIPAFFTGLIGWFFGRKKENVEVKSIDIDNEVKSAAFYQNLLDDASKRLNDAIKAIEERDIRIKQRDEKIEQLIDEIEKLTDELKKYKQLNGKS
ncbi:hypothetical protein [Flavobacterium aestivum]|uniref:hypothetical protein n=1 Tax=Flavobacterium aestivum TaxID=3003257 RepID=UPI0022862B94|nr:hypothetical protein [Flavobacterium aestivum]